MPEDVTLLALKELLNIVVEREGSDLYITEGVPPAVKVDGKINMIGTRKLQSNEVEAFARTVLAGSAWPKFIEMMEANIPLYFPELGRFRVNVFRQKGEVGMVIRLIKTKIPTLDQLELPKVVKSLSLKRRGLILIVGGTGEGKSTTMASMVEHYSSNSQGHIVTVEDPIEFLHEHKKCLVTQREVGIDTESLEVALKNSLRQAPDLIVIGEIRDRNTMEAAITFAETGHLCLSTLHCANASQAMERIINFFPAEQHKQIFMQLSMNLKAVISQRLINSTNGGRVPAVEVLIDSPRIKDLILNSQINEIKETIEKSSVLEMQTFDQALYDLYRRGRISLDEALRNADSANNLRLKIKLEGSSSLSRQKSSGVAVKRN